MEFPTELIRPVVFKGIIAIGIILVAYLTDIDLDDE
jgi:hypothetical protein